MGLNLLDTATSYGTEALNGASSVTDAAYRFVRHEPGVHVVIQGGRFCLPWEHPEAVDRAALDFVA
jgi:hypothetical protein